MIRARAHCSNFALFLESEHQEAVHRARNLCLFSFRGSHRFVLVEYSWNEGKGSRAVLNCVFIYFPEKHGLCHYGLCEVSFAAGGDRPANENFLF